MSYERGPEINPEALAALNWVQERLRDGLWADEIKPAARSPAQPELPLGLTQEAVKDHLSVAAKALKITDEDLPHHLKHARLILEGYLNTAKDLMDPNKITFTSFTLLSFSGGVLTSVEAEYGRAISGKGPVDHIPPCGLMVQRMIARGAFYRLLGLPLDENQSLIVTDKPRSSIMGNEYVTASLHRSPERPLTVSVEEHFEVFGANHSPNAHLIKERIHVSPPLLPRVGETL